MRHRNKGTILGRTRAPRKALLMQLARSLIRSGAITTTHAKARAVRPLVERLVTLSKIPDLSHRRQILRRVNQPETAEKLLKTWGPKYQQRPGGYTRLIKLGTRVGDRAPMARLEFVE